MMTINAKAVLLRLHQAAKEYKIPEQEIKDLIEQGRLDFYELSEDNRRVWLIAKDDIAAMAASRFIRRENFKHLEGIPIGVSEASLKYGFHTGTISQWVEQGHIKDLGPDPDHKQRHLINEADIAYAAALRDLKGLKRGRSLWD